MSELVGFNEMPLQQICVTPVGHQGAKDVNDSPARGKTDAKVSILILFLSPVTLYVISPADDQPVWHGASSRVFHFIDMVLEM